jgi:hypothetical protein
MNLDSQMKPMPIILDTRKYMHAEPRLADKTIIFSEHEVFKVVAIVTR